MVFLDATLYLCNDFLDRFLFSLVFLIAFFLLVTNKSHDFTLSLKSFKCVIIVFVQVILLEDSLLGFKLTDHCQPEIIFLSNLELNLLFLGYYVFFFSSFCWRILCSLFGFFFSENM